MPLAITIIWVWGFVLSAILSAILPAIGTAVLAGSRAWATMHVDVASCASCASSKIMGRWEVWGNGDWLRVDTAHIFYAAIMIVRHVGGWSSVISRSSTSKSGDGGIMIETGTLGGLPVDRLETILKLTGGAKLPLANDGPDGSTGSDTGAGDDETDNHRLGEEGSGLILSGGWNTSRSLGGICGRSSNIDGTTCRVCSM